MTNPNGHDEPDLTALLAVRHPAAFTVWLDPLSSATVLLLPYLDLDGHTNGGRPWRFRGHDDVAMRLLPDPNDELSHLAARCILAVRAWAVHRAAGDTLVPMDYDLPWGYLGSILRDIQSVRTQGLPHLVALAGREGDWLGDWVAEYRDHPAVLTALDRERESARMTGITDPPTVDLGGMVRFEPTSMPDDIAAQVAYHVDQRRSEA
ncbi:MAG TPA: hypothetical protein VMT27_09040 [Actinomycetes bacterium]|nr:hypothetical protein [Actinomycetes bacterium]